MPNLAQTFANVPPKGRITLAVGAVVVIGVFFFMFRLATAPSFTPLATGLDPAQTGKMTVALDEQGLAYELQANGSTIAVQKADVAKARIALAEAGMSSASGGGSGETAGFELFDKQKLGASDFQQQVTYQRALEGEIARTIEDVQGVQGAQVQLVLPEEDLFADESTPATAAVLLTGPAEGLDEGAVRGIAQLTSSSVKGLKPANVTITDGAGQLLWPSGDVGSGGGTGSNGRLAAETRYERALEGSLMALLTRTLGPDKAQVQVKASLNVDDTTTDDLTYARRGTPLKTKTETETLRGSGGGAAGGVAGTASNVPGYAGAGAGANANSNYRRNSEETDFGVNKTVTRTKQAPGRVEKLDVALLVDKSVPAATLRTLEPAIASAAGIDAQRGDTVAVSSFAFAKAPAASPAAKSPIPIPAGLLGPLKWVGLTLALLLFVFFMSRHLKRRESEALATPAWLNEITRPTPLAELEAGATRPMELPTLPDRAVDPSMHKLDQLMDREPERVAAQVRAWLSED